MIFNYFFNLYKCKGFLLLYVVLFFGNINSVNGQIASEISELQLPDNLKDFHYVHDIIVISGKKKVPSDCNLDGSGYIISENYYYLARAKCDRLGFC